MGSSRGANRFKDYVIIPISPAHPWLGCGWARERKTTYKKKPRARAARRARPTLIRTEVIKMIKADAIEYINNRMSIELEQAPKQSNGYDTYICPFCGNGSGSNGDGLSTVDGKCYKCFKCDFYGDYLDILKKQHGTDDMWDIFTLYNIVIDTGLPDISKGFDVRSRERRITTRPKKPEVPAVDHTEYYKLCNSRASQTDYFSQRGISTETINRFMLGYDPAWKHPNVPNAPLTARAIIPASKYSYTARATSSTLVRLKSLRKIGRLR